MNIICPACHTHYAVDLQFPEQGRKVRCAKCGEVWHALAMEAAFVEVSTDNQPGRDVAEQTDDREASGAGEEAGAPLPQIEPAPDIAWMQALAEEDARVRQARLVDDDEEAATGGRRIVIRRRQSMSAARVVQAFVVGVTMAGLLAAFTHKEEIVSLAPSTARLYALAGIDVNIRGLAFENLQFSQETENGVPVLAVSGDIVNVAGTSVAVPAIRLSLGGSNTPELYSWVIEPTLSALGPGETLPFTARLAAPPREAATVSVRFIDSRPTRLGLAR